jgi:hypothetical protein
MGVILVGSLKMAVAGYFETSVPSYQTYDVTLQNLKKTATSKVKSMG